MWSPRGRKTVQHCEVWVHDERIWRQGILEQTTCRSEAPRPAHCHTSPLDEWRVATDGER